MFFTHYTLRLKTCLKDHTTFFWTGIFPFILATLFFLAFGSNLKTDTYDPVPTALVAEDNSDFQAFTTLLLNLSEGTSPVVKLYESTKAEAEELLDDETVDGIITVSDTLHLTVRSSGISQNILKSILDNYLQKSAIFEETAASNPEALTAMADSLTKETQYLRSVSLGDRPLNPMLQFFYALLAMSCMYTSFYGITLVMELQSNLSPLAARRTLTPTKKWAMMLADYLAVLTLSILILLLLFGYLHLLGVDFGIHTGLTILTGIIGCIFGISFGTFVSSIFGKSPDLKLGICLGFSMICCFCAGLMSNYVPMFLEKQVPLLTRINPAQLLTNSFYCLTFYDDFQRFTANLITLLVISLIFGIAGVLFMRRKKYASI